MVSNLLYRGTTVLSSLSAPGHQLGELTIDVRSRLEIEAIKDFSLRASEIPHHKVMVVSEAVQQSVVAEHSTQLFDLAQLDGMAGGKLLNDSAVIRQATTLSEAGRRLVFPESEGLPIQQAIDTCLAWPELRLEQINLLSDDWHRRVYWQNPGGGHHMAKLCQLLKENQMSHTVEVNMLRYRRYPHVVSGISGASVFVTEMDAPRSEPDKVFRQPLLAYLLAPALGSKAEYGLTIGHVSNGKQPFVNLGFLVVDHDAKHADITLAALEDGVQKGRLMSYVDWLSGFGPR